MMSKTTQAKITKKVAAKKGLTPRQKKLALLMAKVEAGTLSMEQAIRQAGFSDKTARQQTATVNRVRQNSAMQEALRKAGVTESKIAQNVKRGMRFIDSTGLGFTKLAAELMDAFPATKNLHGIVDPEELMDQAERDGEYAPWQDADA